MKMAAVILSLVLLAVLMPAETFAWSPAEGYHESTLGSYVVKYPGTWVESPSIFMLKAADTSGFPYLVGGVDTKGKYSTFLDMAVKMGATDTKVLYSMGFVTLPSGLRVKEAKINFVYQGSTYYATVLSCDLKNVYLSCMVVFPWNAYDEAFAQDIFNNIYSKTTSARKK